MNFCTHQNSWALTVVVNVGEGVAGVLVAESEGRERQGDGELFLQVEHIEYGNWTSKEKPPRSRSNVRRL